MQSTECEALSRRHEKAEEHATSYFILKEIQVDRINTYELNLVFKTASSVKCASNGREDFVSND